MRTFLLVLVALFASAAPAMAHDDEPLVIGHRGAPGYLPDHTLQGYALAARMGADYIEPDLVATKDGHLIARHEPNITATTDVRFHPEFARARRPRTSTGSTRPGGSPRTSRSAEIKTLRAVQPLANRPHGFDGEFEIPTFEEVIALAKRKGVGIYPETKHPTFHQRLGLPLEGRLVPALDKAGLEQEALAGLHPVLRAVEPQAAQPHDRRPARAARRRRGRRGRRHARSTTRRGTARTTGPSPATRSCSPARSASSRPTRGWPRSRPTPTGSGRGSATSSARGSPPTARSSRSRRRT